MFVCFAVKTKFLQRPISLKFPSTPLPTFKRDGLNMIFCNNALGFALLMHYLLFNHVLFMVTQ